MAPAATSTFLVAGRRVGWHVYGDPSDRPILFLHGWGMLLSGYRRALDALPAPGGPCMPVTFPVSAVPSRCRCAARRSVGMPGSSPRRIEPARSEGSPWLSPGIRSGRESPPGQPRRT